MAAGTGKSGQQVASEHADTLKKVLGSYAERPLPRVRERLNLSRIAAECGFDRKVFQTNPACKKLIDEAQARDRQRQPPKFDEAEVQREESSKESKERAALEAEILNLRVEVASLREDLHRFRLIESLMLESGRLP